MKYILIFVLLIISSCTQNRDGVTNQDQPFFHFDLIEYYHLDVSKLNLQALQIKQQKTRKEQALLQILTGDVPVSIKDTLFIKNMEILGFAKEKID